MILLQRGEKSFKYTRIFGVYEEGPSVLADDRLVKPLDRIDPTAEALEELARLDQEAGLLEDKGEGNMKYEVGVWYGWNGGECPVHPLTTVEAAFSDGVEPEEAAYGWVWSSRVGRPIIAFRIIEEYKEPKREFVHVSGELKDYGWDFGFDVDEPHVEITFEVVDGVPQEDSVHMKVIEND